MIQWLFRNTIGLTLGLFERYLRRRDATGVTIIALGSIERKAWRVKNDQLKRRTNEPVSSIGPIVTKPTGLMGVLPPLAPMPLERPQVTSIPEPVKQSAPITGRLSDVLSGDYDWRRFKKCSLCKELVERPKS